MTEKDSNIGPEGLFEADKQFRIKPSDLKENQIYQLRIMLPEHALSAKGHPSEHSGVNTFFVNIVTIEQDNYGYLVKLDALDDEDFLLDAPNTLTMPPLAEDGFFYLSEEVAGAGEVRIDIGYLLDLDNDSPNAAAEIKHVFDTEVAKLILEREVDA